MLSLEGNPSSAGTQEIVPPQPPNPPMQSPVTQAVSQELQLPSVESLPRKRPRESLPFPICQESDLAATRPVDPPTKTSSRLTSTPIPPTNKSYCSTASGGSKQWFTKDDTFDSSVPSAPMHEDSVSDP
ncbi:hypothetical protein LINPERHAP2_LOCUS28920 [Linum perenne]